MTLKEQIMNLQTYKMYEGEDTVYVERDDVIRVLEQQLRDCKTCKHSNNGKCAYTEECHECMWENKYEQEPCDDCISRTEALKHSHIEYDDDGEGHRVIYAEDIKELPSVTPKTSKDYIKDK